MLIQNEIFSLGNSASLIVILNKKSFFFFNYIIEIPKKVDIVTLPLRGKR